MNHAELDIKGLDQLLDLLGNLRPVLLQLRGRRYINGITQGHILGKVEKTDLALVNPGFHRELPAIQVRFHQRREFLVGNTIHFIRSADHPVAKAAGLVESLQVNRIVRVTVQLQQGLVNPLQKTDHILAIMGLFENTHTNTAQLGPPLHQGFVPHQHGLPEQTGIIQQHRINRTGPLHSLFKQRYRHIHTHIFQGLGNFQRAVIEALEIPGHIGDIMLLAIGLCPVRGHHHITAIKLFCRLDRVQTPS